MTWWYWFGWIGWPEPRYRSFGPIYASTYEAWRIEWGPNGLRWSHPGDWWRVRWDGLAWRLDARTSPQLLRTAVIGAVASRS